MLASMVVLVVVTDSRIDSTRGHVAGGGEEAGHPPGSRGRRRSVRKARRLAMRAAATALMLASPVLTSSLK